jgi:hypothetical protein
MVCIVEIEFVALIALLDLCCVLDNTAEITENKIFEFNMLHKRFRGNTYINPQFRRCKLD